MADRSHAVTGNLFLGFGLVPLPDAIDAFCFRVREQEEPSGIERFAERAFQEIDNERLRRIVDSHQIVLARIARMDAFYLNFNRTAVDAADAQLLYQVETVLNRLSKLLRQSEGASLSEERCSALDMEAFQRVPGQVAEFLEQTGGHNPWERPGKIRCVPGGEWDVRTRLASLCESISPITHLDYSFTCDAARGAVALSFTCPDASAMPASVYDEDESRWRRLRDDERADLAGEHARRIALVLAAAGFAAGMRIRRCSVEGLDPLTHARAFCVRFGRSEFLAEYASAAQRLTTSPLAKLAASSLLEGTEGEPVVSFAPDDERWLELDEDTRPLPDRLKELLLADTFKEFNVIEPDGSASMRRFEELRPCIAAEPVRAARQLVDLIAELEGACAAHELSSEEPACSQFCENNIARILLPLIKGDAVACINRAPDALYFAQYELTNIYVRSGEYGLALQEARRLLDIASTSTQAHFTLINILARMGLFDDVIEVCKHGLRVAFERNAIAYYFYRMAFAYWSTGAREMALACYAMVPKGEQVSAIARIELGNLLSEMGRAEAPGFEEAVAAVRAAGITVAPSEEVSDRIADVAVLLTDGGFFTLAQGCANYLWHTMGSDEMGAFTRSLQRPQTGRGADDAPAPDGLMEDGDSGKRDDVQ